MTGKSNDTNLTAFETLSPELEERRRRRSIAAFFRERRMSTGLSIKHVAKSLSIDPATLEAYESGLQPIPMDDVFGLTNVLNIPPEDVLGLIHDLYSQIKPSSERK